MQVMSTGAFDDLQKAFTSELIRAIKAGLEKVDAPEDLVAQLTGSIAFSVTSLIDDVSGFEVNGMPASPMLTFKLSDGKLETCGGNSYMHEYVYKLLPKIFPVSTR